MVGSGSINSKLKAGKSDEETQRRLKKMERDGSLGFEVDFVNELCYLATFVSALIQLLSSFTRASLRSIPSWQIPRVKILTVEMIMMIP